MASIELQRRYLKISTGNGISVILNKVHRMNLTLSSTMIKMYRIGFAINNAGSSSEEICRA